MTRFKSAGDIKVGVVGYGGAFNMGRSHLNEMKRAGMTPWAVCEVDQSRLKVAEEEFPGIETYSSVGEMLKRSEVNLIVLITPHDTHAKLAMQCLKAGRHVVCEKPMAITTSECDKMMAVADKNKLVLSTYHNRHWDGSVVRAMKVIQSGKLGDIVRVDAHMGNWGRPGDWWRSSKTISGGILYDWGVHLLEYMLQIVDSDVTEVNAFGHSGFWASKTAWKKDTNEDEVMGTIRFANGMWGTLKVSSIECDPRPSMVEIAGTKGHYSWDYITWQMITPKENGSKTVQSGKNPAAKWDMYYKNVAEHLYKGTKLVITSQWARRPIHILDLMNQSVARQKSMKPKYK